MTCSDFRMLSISICLLLLLSFLLRILDSGRVNSSDSSSTNIDNVRHPIKPRTMAQPPVPLEDSALDTSDDADVTIVPQSKKHS